MRKFLFCFSLSFIFLFTACVSRPQFSPEDEAALYPASSYIPAAFEWEEVCPGISRFDFKNKEFPIIYHAVKIDLALAGPDLTLDCFPNRTTVPRDFSIDRGALTFRGMRTKTFAKRSRSTVALNLSPFSGKKGQWDLLAKLGSTRQLVGLHVADGQLISAPVSQYSAIAFKKEKNASGREEWRAVIEKNQSQEMAAAYDYAFGGFYVVLENGRLCDFSFRNHDSRTGLGLAEDGKLLYILVVEGEFPWQSEGLSFQQCGEIFLAMGCSDAIEMDGGGSSELCINGRSVLSYSVGRYQANSLGFKVK